MTEDRRAYASVRDLYAEGHHDGHKAATEKFRALLTHIAELDRPIECTSLRDWREKVKKMAANALKGTT